MRENAYQKNSDYGHFSSNNWETLITRIGGLTKISCGLTLASVLGVNMWCFVQLTTLLGVTLLHRSFSRFLKCTNGTKSHKASHMYFIQLNKEIYIWSPWTAALPRWFDVLKRCLELQITKTLYKSVKKFAATSRLRK